MKKTVVIFLAKLKSTAIEVRRANLISDMICHETIAFKVHLSEHPGFQWVSWSSPPVPIEAKTIDKLVNKVHEYLTQSKNE